MRTLRNWHTHSHTHTPADWGGSQRRPAMTIWNSWELFDLWTIFLHAIHGNDTTALFSALLQTNGSHRRTIKNICLAEPIFTGQPGGEKPMTTIQFSFHSSNWEWKNEQQYWMENGVHDRDACWLSLLLLHSSRTQTHASRVISMSALTFFAYIGLVMIRSICMSCHKHKTDPIPKAL